MDHPAEAEKLFREGYNCAQALFCAFREDMGLDLKAAARLSSSFGGGMGRLREVCGAVSGAFLVLGVLEGYDDPQDREAKKAHYFKIQKFARIFKERQGSIICRELLKDVPVTPGNVPEERTSEFYERRPCLRLIRESAGILEEMLRQ